MKMSSLTASLGPENRGRRLMPSLLDHLAETDPSRVLYSASKTQDPADGFQDINSHTFARAVNRCAWHIKQQVGIPIKKFPTLTYMGPQDLVYGILVLACIKAGYQLLLTSPRESLAAQLKLLEQTDCNTFLSPPNFPLPIAKQILSGRRMQTVDIPGVSHWLVEGNVDVYPYNKSFDEAKHDPFVLLHTSGSTGWPKPIVQRHATHAAWDAYADIPKLGFKEVFPCVCAGERMYMAAPLFHCGGLTMLLNSAIYSEVTVVLGAFPPSPAVVNGVHVHGNVKASVVPSTTVVELSREPTYLENLTRLDFLMYGGGPCPSAVGDLVSTKTRLTSALGSTEAGIIANEISDPEDYPYLCFSPACGSEYRHRSDGLYEHFIVKSPKFERFQGIFGTFPELQEWPMRDLYSKHPLKDNVWLYRGRADDIIVYQTGEKLNPLSMEDTIGSNASVSAALIAGQGKFQSSLLLETVMIPQTACEGEQLLEAIWPSIETANKQAPSHARIHRDMVLFTSPEKPMLRAGKGTVQRKLTLDLYESEIDALYSGEQNITIASGNNPDNTPKTVLENVINSICGYTNIDARTVAPDANLFELGADSLQVNYLSRELSRRFTSLGKVQIIRPNDIYSNPTVAGLSQHITALLEGRKVAEKTSRDADRIQTTFNHLSSFLPVTVRPVDHKGDMQVVLLTGSTGSLGSYVLDCLVLNPRVSEVFCLNRGPDSAARQKKSRLEKNLSTTLENVHFFDADLSKSYFGLPLETYKKVLAEVTCVVHNAWQVDFNLDFTSFAKHTTGVRHLVDFSAHSRFGAHIFFISSIAAVANFGSATGSSAAVPEQILEDWDVAQAMGYGQSKLISERLLNVASKDAGISATVCRVGQIAGPAAAAGIWPKHEWLPSLIASSAYLGKLPDSLGQLDTIDWIPVDLLAQTVVDLAVPTHTPTSKTPDDVSDSTNQTRTTPVYHLVNPQRTKWSALLPTISRHLTGSTGKSIEIVSLQSWIEILEQSTERVEAMANNPAAKIIDFFMGLHVNATKPVLLDTDRTVRASKILAEVGPVTDAWMENWLRQWSF